MVNCLVPVVAGNTVRVGVGQVALECVAVGGRARLEVVAVIGIGARGEHWADGRRWDVAEVVPMDVHSMDRWYGIVCYQAVAMVGS